MYINKCFFPHMGAGGFWIWQTSEGVITSFWDLLLDHCWTPFSSPKWARAQVGVWSPGQRIISWQKIRSIADSWKLDVLRVVWRQKAARQTSTSQINCLPSSVSGGGKRMSWPPKGLYLSLLSAIYPSLLLYTSLLSASKASKWIAFRSSNSISWGGHFGAELGRHGSPRAHTLGKWRYGPQDNL